MENTTVDTKSHIFRTALRLFAEGGYENSSVRSLAKAVGIKTASLYYHYKSKEEILEACYNYFLEHRHVARLNRKQYEPILREGTREDVMNVIVYNFPEETMENMILTLIIIYSRVYSDSRAKDIYLDDINCSMEYLVEFFTIGIEIGRFEQFDIPTVSLVLFSTRLFCAQSVTIEGGHENKWFKIANESMNELIKLIPFKY